MTQTLYLGTCYLAPDNLLMRTPDKAHAATESVLPLRCYVSRVKLKSLKSMSASNIECYGQIPFQRWVFISCSNLILVRLVKRQHPRRPD